jgi:hypothetical protein
LPTPDGPEDALAILKKKMETDKAARQKQIAATAESAKPATAKADAKPDEPAPSAKPDDKP